MPAPASIKLLCAGLTALGIATPSAAENLIYNSGFELGTEGYAVHRQLQAAANPEFSYTAPVIDMDVHAAGRQSLKTPNPLSEEVNLFVREVKLSPETDYTLSLQMKSATAAYPVRMRVLSFSTQNGSWEFDQKKSVTVGRDWDVHTFTFKTPPKTKKAEHYTILIESCINPGDIGQDLWIDNIQLEQGANPHPWSPGSALEVAVAPADTALSNVFIKNENETLNIKLNVTALNNTPTPVSTTVKVDLRDVYDGRKISKMEFPLELKSGSTAITRELNINRYGEFNAAISVTPADGATVATSECSFVIIGKYEPKPLDVDNRFYVGINTGLSERPASFYLSNGKAAFRAKGLSRDDWMRMFVNMGCRIIRDWDGEGGNAFDWNVIEPKEGQFDFTAADQALELAEKHGVSFLPILGGRIAETGKGRLPDWLLPRCTIRTSTPYRNRPETMREFPPLDSWRNYIRAIAKRYAGRITHYEILNEPNADFFPEEYLALLKIAHEELKAADPHCRIIAFCSSGDYGLPVGDFLHQCAKLGGLNYADIASYHPYETAHYGSKITSGDMNGYCQAMLKKYAPDRTISLWNTELYYLTGAKGSSYAKGLYQARDAAQRYLTDLGDGLGQSICVESRSLWGGKIMSSLSGEYAIQWLATSKHAVYNALARFFEGAKPVGKFRLNERVIAYAYERDGQITAAFWSFDEKGDYTAFMPNPAQNVTLTDLFGNEIPFDGRSFDISRDPCYLRWNKGDLTAVQSTLSHIKVLKK